MTYEEQLRAKMIATGQLIPAGDPRIEQHRKEWVAEHKAKLIALGFIRPKAR